MFGIRRRQRNEFTPLPKEVNERANKLIIGAIARIPMSGSSALLAAKSVLGEFDGVRTGIGIREIARMQPDGKSARPVVHRIHEIFGIPYKPKRNEIVRAMTIISLATLRNIGESTVDVCKEADIPAPNIDVRTFYPFNKSPIADRILAADSLHSYLQAATPVRKRVQDDISARADIAYDLSARHKEQLQGSVQPNTEGA